MEIVGDFFFFFYWRRCVLDLSLDYYTVVGCMLFHLLSEDVDAGEALLLVVHLWSSANGIASPGT